MQKIISLFQRNYDGDRLVRNEVTPGCEWVLAGEGRASRKFDGTCVMFDGERWWARREVKKGKQLPPDFREVEYDDTTGNRVGWEPAEQSGYARWLAEAQNTTLPESPGTYELCGVKVQGNPEHFIGHVLIRHGECVMDDAPRDFDGLRRYFEQHDIEGIVWWHPDGRKCKIKARDFGVKRGLQSNYATPRAPA